MFEVQVIGCTQVTNFLDQTFHCSNSSFSLSLVSYLLFLKLLGLLLGDIVGFLEVLGDVNPAIFGYHALHFHLAATLFSAHERLILIYILDRAG